MPYQKVQCIYPTQCCTLVSANKLQPHQYKTQLESMHTMDDLDEVHCCEVRGIGAECIFTTPAPLAAKLFEKIGSVTYVHQCVPLIYSVMQFKAEHSGTVLGINLSSDFVNMALRVGTELKLYNTYNISSPQDLIYFILLIIRQFDLDRWQTNIMLAGDFKDAYIAELTRFFDNVLRVKVQDEFCAAELRGHTDPRFDLLFLLEQCE